MKARLLLNLALAALVAALALVVWLKPASKKPASTGTLTALKAAAITHIRIVRGKEPPVELVKNPQGWQLTAPLALRADQYLVKSLLDDIGEATHGEFTARDAELSKYGLAPPHLKLWLNDTELEFGDTEPLNDYRYVKLGDRIKLASDLLYYRADHAPLWWADKRLLPENAHIAAIQLPNATLTLKHGKWQLVPANPAVSADAIQSLVNAWSMASAISVAPLGKAASEGEVAIALQGGNAPLRFAILKNPDFLVLARPDLGLQYELDREQRDSLLSLKTAPAKTPRTGKTPHARTAGSGNRAPRP